MLKSWFVLVFLLWSGFHTLYAMDKSSESTSRVVILCPQPNGSWSSSWSSLCHGVAAYWYMGDQGNGVTVKDQRQNQLTESGILPQEVSMSDLNNKNTTHQPKIAVASCTLTKEQKAIIAELYFDVPGGRPVTPPWKKDNECTGLQKGSREYYGTPCGSFCAGSWDSK